MGRKNYSLLHSQKLGIAWLSVCLLLIAGVVIFALKSRPTTGEKGAEQEPNVEILQQREDSVYRDRYQQRVSQRSRSRESYRQPRTRDTLPTAYYAHTPVRKQPLVVDLNEADSLTLTLLYGIGPTYASRIVRYRERLGGFVSMEQLLDVYGITPELLARLAPHLTLSSDSIRRIDLDSVSLKQLARHPYIEYYQARDIVRLRDKGLRFRSADDLRSVPSMTDSAVERLLPYLDFRP